MTSPSPEVLDNKICNMEKQLNRIEEKLDTFISTAEDKFARKDSVKKLWTIVWSIIGFFFVALGTTIVAIVKYFLSLNIQ
jgi:hypothetical protein